ncbi:MAG: PspC domain-containing protein [Thiotrichaceae bacterium]|nr:PspC domain-containing protein [Thiotrichaceae bacterium]
MALHKNQNQAKLFGVCAGIAQYWGADVALIRIMTVFFSFIFPPTVFFYVLLAFLLSNAPQDDSFSQALEVLEQDFKLIEMHVLQLEDYVTSDAFALHKKLWDL